MDEGYYWDLLRPLFQGRKVIVAGVMLGGSTTTVDQLTRLGATDVFLLAESRGTGPIPEGVPSFNLDVSATTVMGTIRAGEAATEHLPDAAVTALSRFDPDGDAIVLGNMFNALPEIGGRRALFHRRPEWIALEDKVVIDERWDRWGIERAPSLVVPATYDELMAAANRLDAGAGTVWAGDAREGWHGGAEYLRWVCNDDDAADAAAFLSAHCDVARVTPFLEGVPCSIHGIVFDDDVSVFRPLELVTLRRRERKELVYAGLASFWDPKSEDREAMQEVARRAGAGLRRDVDYRGAFTVDGVMTVDGFRPTELNTRSGGGLGMLNRALPDLPLLLVIAAATSGAALDFRPRQLEQLVVQAADANRTGGTWRGVEQELPHVDDEPVAFEGDHCRSAETGSGETPDGRFTVGPAPLGSFVRLGLDAGRWPVGPHVGPAAAAFWRYISARFGLGTDDLVGATDVRQQVREASAAN